MFEQRRVQILLFILFATIVIVVVLSSLNSPSSTKSTVEHEQRSGKLRLETFTGEDASLPDTARTPIDYIRVAMCSTNPNITGHAEAEKFCKCGKDGVVSCDFSEFRSDRRTSAELGAFWEEDTIKRICICGAPRNFQAHLGEQFLGENRQVNRVDIYNMAGPVVIEKAFRTNFGGELYMSKLHYLDRLYRWDIGRGYDIPLSDTTHLSCCSKIETPKLSMPTFFMEDSTVGTVENSGINDAHLWGNIIFQNVTFSSVKPYGISLNLKNLNVSFTNCNFHNLERAAIAVQDITNMLIAHSTFHPTCDKLPVGARSLSRNSTIAFISNDFYAPTILEVDARAVAVWFNAFTIWNNETFRNLNATQHYGERQVSFEFNTVDELDLGPNSIPPLKPKDKVVFNENLIIHCSCDGIEHLNLPTQIKGTTQRCHSHDGKELLCHLNLTQVTEECAKNQAVSFSDLCSKEDHTKSFFNARTFEEAEKFVKATTIRIESDFMNTMLKYVDSPFTVHPAHEKTPGNANGNGTQTGGSTVLQSVFTIFHLSFVLMVPFLMRR